MANDNLISLVTEKIFLKYPQNENIPCPSHTKMLPVSLSYYQLLLLIIVIIRSLIVTTSFQST
jgi:hypothetical protein